MAFQERKIHPNTLLHDNSKLFGLWNPANFTGKFRGKITAEKALTSSLNLPALEVISMVGPLKFINTLNTGAKRVYVKNDSYDYSVILGSPVVSLYNLARFYAMLNEDGILNHYSLYQGDLPEQSVRLLSSDSARVTWEILKSTGRPYNGVGMPGVSYKTGTSSKFTDALAAGSFNNNTVAVAIRFPDNHPGPYRYDGYKDASPVLFDLFANIQSQQFIKEPLESELFIRRPPDALKEVIEQEKTIDRRRLRIMFPVSGDTVMPDFNNRVFIKSIGGEGKIFLTVDDRQYETDYFVPEREGMYEVSVMDEQGRSDSVSFRVVFGQSEP